MTSPTSPLLPLALGDRGASSFMWRSGAVLTLTGMFTGAFGAHGLKHRAGVTTDGIHAWETASTYAIVNGLGLMLVSTHSRFSAHPFAAPAILMGGVLFSGSIMLLILNRGLKYLGPITPLGGLIMMAGYASLAL